VLHELWRVVLRDNGMDLHGIDAMCSMVYGADSLYDKPVSPQGAHEADEMEPEQSVNAGYTDLTWLLEVPPEGRDFIQRLSPEVVLAALIPAPEGISDPMAPGSALGAVPVVLAQAGPMRVLRRESVPRGLTGRSCAIRATRRRPTRRSRYRRSRLAAAGSFPRPMGRPPREDQDDIRHH
jgi:hypothetical protein